METVKMSTAVQTKTVTASDRSQGTVQAAKSGDFVKLLQEKSQGDTAGSVSGKETQAGSKTAPGTERASEQKKPDRTEEQTDKDMLGQAEIQQAAAQIAGMLQEEFRTEKIEILQKTAVSLEETGPGEISAGADAAEVLGETQGSKEAGNPVEAEFQAADSSRQTEAKGAASPEAAREPVVLRVRPETGEPQVAKVPEQAEKEESQETDNAGEAGQPPKTADSEKPETSDPKVPETEKDPEALKAPAKPQDPAKDTDSKKDVSSLQGRELAAGPVQKKEDSGSKGMSDRDENGVRILRGLTREESQPEENSKTGFSTAAAVSRGETRRSEAEDARHLTYRSDSLQNQQDGMYEVYTTKPVHIKTSYSQLPQDLGKTLAARLPGSGQEMVIELEPASLGKLTIKLAYEAGRAAVSILTSNPRTLEILNQKASEIAAILEEKTGQETIIYTHAPEQKEQEPDSDHSGAGRQQQEENSKKDQQDQHQAESFAQQLRLGLI